MDVPGGDGGPAAAKRARQAGGLRRQLVVGEAWDTKRGGNKRDVLVKANWAALTRQSRGSRVTHWAPDCRPFTRARRERPILGARSAPRPLRSAAHPRGFPNLSGEAAGSVRNANAMADGAADECLLAYEQGRSFSVENSAKSRMWKLEKYKALMRQPGVFAVDFHNCMFGGSRRKRTRFLTNVASLEEALGRRCSAADVCSRTGVQHDSFEPIVVYGKIISFPTSGEAEYPKGLCEAYADAIATEVGGGNFSGAFKYDFTEVFAGFNAPLSNEVGGRQTSSSVGVEAPAESVEDNTKSLDRSRSPRRKPSPDPVPVGRWGNALALEDSARQARQEEEEEPERPLPAVGPS